MERYYVKRPTGKVFGPFDQNAIRLMIKGNKLGTDAQVSTDKETWTPISEVPAFADDAGNTTRAGGLGVQDLPTSSGGPSLPTPRSVPDLPRPKLSDLPKPKLSDLPKPKLSDLPRPKSDGPELPTPRGISDLPRPAGSNLPTSAGSNLPASAGGNLPTSAAGNLPTSSGGNLPTSAAGNLPTSSGGNLPTSADDDDLFAAPVQDDDDLFAAPIGAGAADDDDLFAAPIGAGAADDDDDLFAAPIGAGAADSAGDDDLFAAPIGASSSDPIDEDEDDLFAAPLGDEPSDDLFGPAPGIDEDSDDLFAAPPAPDDDPFAAPDDDPFAAPAASNAPDPFDQGDDLFEAPKLDDDDLFAEAPADEDDFLGGDQGFSFLDEEPEGDDWDAQLVGNDSFDADDLGVNEADWGDDMMGGPAPAAAAPPPRQPEPARSRPQPQASSGHDPFRPASTGIKEESVASKQVATTGVAQTVDADKKRGAMAAIGVPVLAVLVLGAAGFGVYTSFFAQEEVVQQTTAPVAPQITTLSPDLAIQDNYGAYLQLFAQAEKGELETESSALLLLAQSFYLTRYEDDAVAAAAETLAGQLAGDEGAPMVAAALAANEARLAQADAAAALAEPALTDTDASYWGHLSAGVAYALASLDGQYEGADAEAGDAAANAPAEGEATPEQATEDAAAAEEAAAEESAEETTPPSDEALAEAEEPQPESAPNAASASLFERAVHHLTLASEVNDTVATPHYWHARVLASQGDPTAALEALERGSNADPNHVATRLLAGKLYYEGGDLNDASEHLGKIISELGSSASTAERGEAHHIMGLVHMARQQSEESIQMFTEALNIDSSRVDSLRALAEQYERAEMYQEALNFFTTNQNLGQEDPEVMLGIVRSHMGLEEYNEAILKLEEGEKEFPEDARFPFYLGRLNMQRGTFYEARRAFERAVEIDPSLLTAQAALAQLAWRIDNDVARGEDHVRAITERPEGIDAAIAAQVADYYRLSERRELAQQWNEEALRLDPNFWNARLNLSRLLLEDGQSERALELLERARAEGIEDIRLSAYLADAYRQAEQFDRAIDEINKVIEAEPSNEEYIFIRGRIYFDRGNYETAREDFNKAYELNPRYHDAYFYVGRTALAEEDFNTAKRIFSHVLDYQPNNGEFHYFMGRTFEAEESETQALTQYQRATTVDPAYAVKNPEIFVRRGLLLARTGATRAGKNDILRALELKPDMIEAQLALGEANFREQNYPDAIKHYATALETSPERPLAQYQYGMALIYEGQREDGARHLQQAIRFGYDNPEIYRRLGYLYRELNQRPQAVESFKTYLRETADLAVPDATRSEMLQQIRELGG